MSCKHCVVLGKKPGRAVAVVAVFDLRLSIALLFSRAESIICDHTVRGEEEKDRNMLDFSVLEPPTLHSYPTAVEPQLFAAPSFQLPSVSDVSFSLCLEKIS